MKKAIFVSMLILTLLFASGCDRKKFRFRKHHRCTDNTCTVVTCGCGCETGKDCGCEKCPLDD